MHWYVPFLPPALRYWYLNSPFKWKETCVAKRPKRSHSGYWLHFHKFKLWHTHTAHETATCRNPHNSSSWDSHVTRQLGYKHTLCQNVVSTKEFLFLIFSLKHNLLKCWSTDDLVGFFPVPFKTVYRWVAINCCAMNDMAFVNQMFIADVWGCVTLQSISLKTDLNVGKVVIKF